MIELRTEFIGRGEVRGFYFKQLLTSEAGYLYEVKPPDSNSYYEVFERRENRLYGTITYPSSKAFGLYAWTFKQYETALIKFNNL